MDFRFVLTALFLINTSHLCAQPIAITGATVYDGKSTSAPLKDAVIIIQQEKILCIGRLRECPISEGMNVIDFSGSYITPGLIDSHVHFMLSNWFDTRQDSAIDAARYNYETATKDMKDNPERVHRSNLCSGVTGVFDAGGYSWTLDLEAPAEHHHERVHVTAAGPLITHEESAFSLFTAMGESAFLPMKSDQEAIASVKQLAKMGAKAIKVWYLAPQPEEQKALDARLMLIGREAKTVGLPLVLHATDLRGAKVAIRAGAHALLHSIDDQLVDDEFLLLAKKQGTYYAPTLNISQNWARGMVAISTGQSYPIDDPNNCIDSVTKSKIMESASLQDSIPESLKKLPNLYSWLENVGRDQATMMENLKRVNAAGIKIATATDAGHPLTFHGQSIYAEMETMEKAGLSPAEIIVMSTQNGAGVMGRLKDIGTLEKGKIADLVILADDPGISTKAFRTITHVMRGGKLNEIHHFSDDKPLSQQ
ncbi:MAG: imidazolonepropionase-like amidohydrolase [Paraglaciecola sp.]|jgi:imidazolonepropionase-like amidohydrolase